MPFWELDSKDTEGSLRIRDIKDGRVELVQSSSKELRSSSNNEFERFIMASVAASLLNELRLPFRLFL